MLDLDNPYPELDDLRASDPVSRVGDSPFFAVTSWDLIADAVSRPEDFSSNLTATMVWHADGSVTEHRIARLGSPLHVLATADGDDHRAHRALVMPSLVPKKIAALAPFIETTVARLWEENLHDGALDWMGAIAHRLPILALAELVGFPVRDVDDLVDWSFASTVLLDGVVSEDRLAAAVPAVGHLMEYLSDAFDAAVADPGDDVLGDLARKVAAGTLAHDTAVMVGLQLVTAGSESTVSLLGSAVHLLGTAPQVQQRLRADRSLIPVFVEEALRLESPFRGHFRHVLHDTTLGEVDLPAGAHLYLMWGAANRDPEVFDAPARIDLDPAARRSHMAFGKGLHLCVGAALARLEAARAIEHLLDHTPDGFDLDPAPPEWERSLLSRRLRTLRLTVRS